MLLQKSLDVRSLCFLGLHRFYGFSLNQKVSSVLDRFVAFLRRNVWIMMSGGCVDGLIVGVGPIKMCLNGLIRVNSKHYQSVCPAHISAQTSKRQYGILQGNVVFSNFVMLGLQPLHPCITEQYYEICICKIESRPNNIALAVVRCC